MSHETGKARSLERLELDRLRDIQQAIEEIHGHPRFREGRPAWDADKYYRGYCERQLAIVGEAASKLATEHKYDSFAPEIPWTLIKGLRNILVHAYWRTDKDILWKIIDQHLPELKGKTDAWIREKEKSFKDDLEATGPSGKESKIARKLREATEKQPPSQAESE